MNIECDDIRDIINNIQQFNENNELKYDDIMVVCDINSMYDNISPQQLIMAFKQCTDELLPFNYLNTEMIKLFYKAFNHVFKNAIFKYKTTTYKFENSQIQGTISGGDCCSLYLITKEIINTYQIYKYTKFIIRYKDDIFFIPKIKIQNKNECNNKIIQNIYKGFKFDVELSKNKAEICDVIINIDQNTHKLRTTTLNNKNKITSYINKSSNVKQSINGIFKTLQQRYIIIDDDKSKYKTSKTRICHTFIHNE